MNPEEHREILWRTKMASRRFREARREARRRWDDRAARTLARRFLNPRDEHDERMLGAWSDQETDLQVSAEHLERSTEHVRRFAVLSRRCGETVERARGEGRAAEHSITQSMEHETDARAARDRSRALVHRANQCCRGVPQR